MTRLPFLALCSLAACLVLAACDSGTIMHEDAPATPSASAMVRGQHDFVGRWAASADACGQAAWTMTPQRLQSPGAFQCSISQLSPTMAGYTVNGGCSQGGASTPGRVVMTLVGGPPATGMTLTDGPFVEPLTLVRCPA